MNKLFLILITFLLSAEFFQAQTTINGSFVYGGITRTYSFYVPALYTSSNPVPLVIGLHGTGSSGTQFAQYRNFRPIADTANFIMVHPDGSTMLGQKFWNFGNVLGSTVDDVGFFDALIDTISAHYSINQNRIYSVGMSNGGFMTYYLACQTNRFAAIGSVTGSMGTTMYNNCNPQRPTPSIHIHGTSDPTNPYAGNSTSKSISAVTRFWVNQNGCDTVPVVTSVPNTNTADGATAERHLYSNGINGNTVEHFKVIGGEHTWPNSPMPGSTDVTCMDFDARIEIWRFFSQYQLNTIANINYKLNNQALLNLWPNPSHGTVYFKTKNIKITNVSIINMQGQIIDAYYDENIQCIDLRHLKQGTYLTKISGNNFTTYKKLILIHTN